MGRSECNKLVSCIYTFGKRRIKVVFWNELLGNIYGLGLNLLGYHLFGLEGLGFLLISYVLYFLQVFLFAKHKYQFDFSPKFYKIFSIQLLMGVLCFAITMFFQNPIVHFRFAIFFYFGLVFI
jgi:O-antigen/teichoic acid export membrane protein